MRHGGCVCVRGRCGRWGARWAVGEGAPASVTAPQRETSSCSRRLQCAATTAREPSEMARHCAYEGWQGGE